MQKLPPIKNTSGEGFAVEDLVAAWLACHLLSNIPWPNPQAGYMEAVNCQMRQDKWHFDDFVIDLKLSGQAYRIACSVKSFPVFGKEGAPIDFKTIAWKEWLGMGDSPFQRTRDKLAIFTAPHDQVVREAWLSLLDMARADIAPETLACRCLDGSDPSEARRDAFTSMQCPAEVDVTASGEPAETARLMRGLFLQEQDFDHAESQSVKEALLMCQQALQESARSQAAQLWHEILIYAAEIRKKGGRISLPNLLARVAHAFPLKHSPQYAQEWQRIAVDSDQQIAALAIQIGGTYSVQRQRLLDSISGKGPEKRITLLVGNSGFGKTVLARNWAVADNRAVAVWVRASDLAAPGGLFTRWKLEHDLQTVFANASKPARLCIDGLDKCYDETTFNEAVLLVKSALTEQARDRWSIVITCIPDDWERVNREFIRRGLVLQYSQTSVGHFLNEEVRDVCDHIPSLKSLWLRPHLHSILRWPKALDLAATHWRSSASPQWTSESDFARWFWHSAICRDQSANLRDQALRKLACILADKLSGKVKLVEFCPEEQNALLELERECYVTIDQLPQTVQFAHELIADWARLRELQAQGSSAASFIRPRLQSPVWHRALRYYALDLLEHNSTAAEWQELFREFKVDEPTCEIAQNLLLEAPIFALQQRPVLENLWPVLIAAEGNLLRRFLRQFLRVATIPDDRYGAQLRKNDPQLQLEIAVRFRLPWAPYWLGVLAFLGSHQDDVIRHAREEIADVCLLWLALHEATKWEMQTAANLAVAAAKLLYLSGERGHARHGEVCPEQKVCAALMAAAPVLPEAVADLVLKLSGRHPPSPEDRAETARLRNASPDVETLVSQAPSANAPKRHLPPIPLVSIFSRHYGPPQPWPEGPQSPCHINFRDAFLNGASAAPLLKTLPKVAEEVMFASLLDIPRKGSSPRDENRHIDLDEHGFDIGDFKFKAAFWTNGPYFTFLKLQPKIALSAIIRLVNFATDRAVELGADVREPVEVPIVVINGETKTWRGHRFCYLWHQGHVFGPKQVCCALLSLEKWFYTLMDEGASLDEPIATIFRESRSIALAGVLVCIGKRRPELFLNSLRPILAAAELYWIEETFASRGEGSFRASMLVDPPSLLPNEIVREWVEMPHRKENFGQLVLKKLLKDPQWRAPFEEICSTWQARVAIGTPEKPAPPWLPRIAAQFDLKNWKTETNKEGTLYKYKPPSQLPQPTAEDLEKLKLHEVLVLWPFRCSQVLNGDLICPEEQLAALWDELPGVRKLRVPEAHNELHNVEDTLCGIVAVAVVHHRKWLAAKPEREKQAIEILVEVGKNPPGLFWLFENDFCDFKWDIFAAWAIATLWTEAPENEFLRQSVASFAVWDREIVVDRVLRVAAERRMELGKHFEQLLAHAIRYAPIKERLRIERQLRKKNGKTQKRIVMHMEKFMTGRTKPLPSSWSQIPQPQRWRSGVTNGMDIGHLRAALGWAEDLNMAKCAAERDSWIELYHQALKCAVRRMQNEDVCDNNRNGFADNDHFPYKDESDLLKRVGAITARLNPGEPHRLLWEPILALGSHGKHWISAFTSYWFIEATRTEQVAPAFIEQWAAMLKYAEKAPTWRPSSRGYWELQDSWQDLLGLSPFSNDFWRAELREAVETVRPFFHRWACRSVAQSHHACLFICFLKTPAAEPMRLDGLCLLKEHIKLDDSYFWDEQSTQDCFAGFLRMLLDQHWPAITKFTAYRDAFMAFALKLKALQHPLGTEITTIAAARLGGSGQT